MIAGRAWSVVAVALAGGCFYDPSGSPAEVTGGAATTGGGAATTVEATEDTGVGVAVAATSPADPSCGDACTITEVDPSKGGDTETTGAVQPAGPVSFTGQLVGLPGAIGLTTAAIDPGVPRDIVAVSASVTQFGIVLNGVIGASPGTSGTAIVTVGSPQFATEAVVVGVNGEPAQLVLFRGEGEKLGEVNTTLLAMKCFELQALASGDIDADGAIDVVAACVGLDAAVVVSGSGDGFGVIVAAALPFVPVTVALADVLGGPEHELIAAGPDRVAVYESVAGTLLSEPTQVLVNGGVSSVSAGLLNGDDRRDLLVGGLELDRCLTFVWADGALVPGADFECGTKARDVLVADLNADGFDEAVSVHVDGLRIGFNRGDGTFDPPVFSPLAEAYEVVAGDFDGDAKVDLAVAALDAVALLRQD